MGVGLSHFQSSNFAVHQGIIASPRSQLLAPRSTSIYSSNMSPSQPGNTLCVAPGRRMRTYAAVAGAIAEAARQHEVSVALAVALLLRAGVAAHGGLVPTQACSNTGITRPLK